MATTIERYHPVLRLLHWLTALLILGVVIAGAWIVYFDPGEGPLKVQLYHLHESVGMLVWLLVLLRIAVRYCTGAPKLPAATPPAVRVLATLNQVALYWVLLTQPLIGLSDANAAGAPLHWFELFEVPWVIGKSPDVVTHALSAVHWFGAVALLVLLAMHIAGAAYHGLVRRDGVLRHMV